MKTDKTNQNSSARRYGILLVIWSALLGGSLLWAMRQETRNTLDIADAAARTNISKDIGFRRWATSHGGVYVPPTEHTPPNPYLKVPTRDVLTTTGKELTLMNPAYMLREMQTDFPGEYGTKSHITSLKLLNPNNAPDAWEAAALRAFDLGEKERVELQQIDGQPFLRMMRPLVTESGCLKCHAFQGYKVGDVRGGISTSISLTPYLARERRLKNSLALTHGVIWLIGLAGLGFSYRSDRRQTTEREKTANELRESEAKFSAISAAVMDGLIMVDDSSALVYWNPAAERILGYRADEVLGKPLHQLLTPQRYQNSAIRGFNAFRNTGQGAVIGKTIEIEALHKDGHEIPVELSISALKLNGHWHAVGILRDITESRQAAATLSQLAAIVESSSDAIIGKTTDGIIINWNKAAEMIYGYTADEIIGKHITTLAPASHHAEINAILGSVRKGGTVANYESERIRKDGSVIQVALTLSPIRDASGNITGISTIARDITDKRRMEEELRRANVYNRSLIEASLDPLVTINAEGKITDVNQATEKVTGRSRSELTGTDFSDYFTDPDKARAGYQQVFDQGFVTDYPLALRHRDGHVTDVLYNASVYRNEAGEVLGVLAAARDITERKKAEFILRQSEEGLKEAQRIAHLGSWYLDIATNQVFWSEELYKMYGFDPALPPPLYTESMKLFTPESWERLSTAIARATETGIPYELELETMQKDGGRGWMLARGELVRDERGVAVRVRGVAMDISERKKAETELRELNNDFVTLLESTGDFIYFKDKDSRIRFCSQTLATITGHRSWRDMIGKHDQEIFPQDTARIYYEEELPIFREGKPLLNKTDPYYDAQGRAGWVNTNKWPVFGDDKKTVVGIFGISRDVTELKEAEDKINELNRNLEKRVVERTAQLEAANSELESFSYSVSHDLRAPLRAIDGFSHILQDDYADKLDEEGRRLLGVVRDNTGRMNTLIDDILKFSRAGRLEVNYSEIDMEKMARAVVAELQPAIADDKLQLEIGQIPPARGDNAMMHQVFVNLLSNAIKFTRNSIPAKIKVGGRVEENETVYYVQDNGAGFDMRYADKLFGVFQRLHGKNEFEGTGIGLAIVKRIISRHGGRVWAEGKVNEGATIYFALPRADRPSA